MTSLLITSDGDLVEISPKGAHWTAEELTALIGGDILPTYIGKGEVIYSRKQRGGMNLKATNIMIQRCASYDEPIYGPAIVMKMSDEPR